MSTITTGRVLLVAALALGLIVTAPAVSAHGGEPTAQPPTDHPGTDADSTTWAQWMESHMESYMGPGAVEWMESHMGLSVDQMARDMAAGGHAHGGYGQGHDGYSQDHDGYSQDHDGYGGMQGGYGNGHC